MKFYQLPNSNLFTHCMLFFSREATSEIYARRVYSLSYLPSRSIFIRFYFQIYISKNPKILCCTYFIRDLFIQSTTILSHQLDNFWHRYPKGINNPFNTSVCEVLLFVCRCRLRCVAWFSYWFDNLGFFTEGNTYRRSVIRLQRIYIF